MLPTALACDPVHRNRLPAPQLDAGMTIHRTIPYRVRCRGRIRLAARSSCSGTISAATNQVSDCPPHCAVIPPRQTRMVVPRHPKTAVGIRLSFRHWGAEQRQRLRSIRLRGAVFRGHVPLQAPLSSPSSGDRSSNRLIDSRNVWIGRSGPGQSISFQRTCMRSR